MASFSRCEHGRLGLLCLTCYPGPRIESTNGQWAKIFAAADAIVGVVRHPASPDLMIKWSVPGDPESFDLNPDIMSAIRDIARGS